MPPKKSYPPRNHRFVAHLSKPELKALEEIQKHYRQPTLASAFRLMIDKVRTTMELAPVSEKGE